MSFEQKYLSSVAKSQRVRVSVRGICVYQDRILLQKPSDDADARYAFIGGALEYGETMADRLIAEYREEFGIEVASVGYLFVVENRFLVDGGMVHGLEHYFRVEVRSAHVEQREEHIVPYWIPVADLQSLHVRPIVVKDAICDGRWRTEKHFVVPVGNTKEIF